MDLHEIADVADGYTGKARTVLEYSLLMKSLVELAKGPGFSKDSWAPLADIVATDEFVRVGNFKEVMNWPEYVDFLTNWATASTWEVRSSDSPKHPTSSSSNSRNAAVSEISPAS